MARQFRFDGQAVYEPLQLALNSPEFALSTPPLPAPRLDRPTASPDRRDDLRSKDRDIADASSLHNRSNVQGLGLIDAGQQHLPRIKRVPVGSKSETVISRAFSSPPSLNQTFNYVPSQTTTAQNTPSRNNDNEFNEWPSPKSSRHSLRGLDQVYQNISSNTNLLQQEQPFVQGCPTRGDILRTRWSWYCYAIIVLSIFSTLFSGIFLGIALRKPRWNGLKKLPVETATLLSAFFSKLIELSFACVFVATLGQILSRKAFTKRKAGQSGGISIAEMNMRLWILQPGTLLTHWTGAWFALRTTLGVVVLLAAVAAALYITAAEALVSPKLSFGKNETQDLVGTFNTIYANALYLNEQCETPITKADVGDEEGASCMQIKYAGQSYRNFDNWLTNWGEKIHAPIDMDPPDFRPPPIAMIFDNTTVQGQWIFSGKDKISVDSQRFGRLVHNITLAMPHANVVHAVRDSRNQILQPEDLKGDGEYYVEAAVPAPILNVLCVGMTDDDVAPMIINDSLVPDEFPFSTNVDDIFGFKQDPSSTVGDNAPWFPKTPAESNSILNRSSPIYGNKAIYLLSASPSSIQTAKYTLCAIKTSLYPHCTTSYHVAQSGGEIAVHCNYDDHVDNQNTLPYSKFNPAAPVGAWTADWPSIGDPWASAVALSQGISNANASISRTLLKMTPTHIAGSATTLNPKFPTLSEGLGVLAGSTLLISSDNSPFAHMWNYTGINHFDIPQDQHFGALLSYKDYASGNNAPWQGLFYVVLFAVFLLNLFCLCYLLWTFYTDGEVTDYTEPQNLFALAINSPPSHIMSGSCGAGPDGDMLRKKWTVDIALSSPQQTDSPQQTIDNRTPPVLSVTDRFEHTHPHFYVRCSEDDMDQSFKGFQDRDNLASNVRQRKVSFSTNSPESPFCHATSPYVRARSTRWSPLNMFSSLWNSSGLFTRNRSSQKIRPRSVVDARHHEAKGEESPALEQYKRLTGRR